MKQYVKDAVKELQASKKKKIESTLKDKNDYKKNGIRILYNRFINKIQRKIVPSHIKNFLLRTIGMKVGRDVCIPHDINFDVYFPELINLGEGSLIGGECNFITHQLKGKKLVLGKVETAKRAMIGGGVNLMPGSKVSKNTIIMFFSDVYGETPEGVIWSGKPAKLLMKLSKEDIDKYFRPSKNRKNYYREFRQKVADFRKDPNNRFFKMHYDGKRLNAGDDWHKARSLFRIYYNGVLVELARIVPWSFLRKTLYRLMGVKIGKNVYLGKGVVFDHIWGDLIEVEDNVRIGENTYLDGHEYTISQTIFGKSTVKNGSHIKHHSFVRAGTTIGENTTIEPWSMAQREIPPNVVVKGFPGKIIREKRAKS